MRGVCFGGWKAGGGWRGGRGWRAAWRWWDFKLRGFVYVGVEVVMLLTHERLRWWKAAAFVVGVLIIASGPVGYYVQGGIGG